jgi:hypothetical protein
LRADLVKGFNLQVCMHTDWLFLHRLLAAFTVQDYDSIGAKSAISNEDSSRRHKLGRRTG